jgi:hypothetical protein
MRIAAGEIARLFLTQFVASVAILFLAEVGVLLSP